jgi:hypothetical protein
MPPRNAADLAHPAASAPASVTPEFALWRLAFRPFYLLASIFAAISILLWIGEYAGVLPNVYLRDPVWHAHEMLFGYTIAVIAGFLFTAGRNWTGKPTPTGPLLAGYALLWLAGRIMVFTPYPVAAAMVNAAFPIAVAAGLVAAAGVPQLIGGDMIKPGATVVDVGVHRTADGLVGDVKYEEAAAVAGAITPVPGGVGPMTVAMLLVNTVAAAEQQAFGR